MQMFNTSGVVPCHKLCVLPLGCFLIQPPVRYSATLPYPADLTHHRLKSHRLEGVSGGHLAQHCSKHSHLEQAAQGLSQSNFDDLYGWRFRILTGQLVPVFDHLHGKTLGF